MRAIRPRLAIVLTCLAACSQPEARPTESAAPPEPAAQANAVLFGEGVVSTSAPEFATAFSPEGETVYFNRASEDRSRLTLMGAELQDGRWNGARALPFSGESRDVDPFVSPDGSRLFFSSDRPSEAGSTGFDTWWVDRLEDGWGPPVRPGPPLNTEATEVFVSTSREGDLYFASDRDGTTRIYSSHLEDGEYRVADVVAFDMNLAEGAGNPLISPDGQLLFFVSDREGGAGGADLYVTRREGGGWSPARSLKAPANSPYADFAPALSPDGKILYFTSERPGVVRDFPEGERRPGDIFQVPLDAVLPEP